MKVNVKFNYQDYLLMPEDKRCEIIEGDLLMTPAPRPKHQEILRKLFDILETHVLKHKSGNIYFAPTDVFFSQENIVQPDLLFISKDRLGIIKDKYIQGPPDLVVEVLSPSDRERDTEIKRKLYAKYGVREFWLVDPEADTVEVAVLKEAGLVTERVYSAGTKTRSPLLARLTFDPARIFSPE